MNVLIKPTSLFLAIIIVATTVSHVNCKAVINSYNVVREKRGAAYAGGHPGGGYGVGGVGIPGLNNAAQYAAYNTLLSNSNHGQSSGYGGGGSSHGRKLTVDQAIGMFGHHTLNTQYPYTQGHDSSSGSGGQGGGGGGYGQTGASNYGSAGSGGGSRGY